MTNPRIALTQPGYNVLTETDKRHFIFDSNYNTFKIIKTGVMTFSVGNGVLHEEAQSHGLAIQTGCYGFLKSVDLGLAIPCGVKYYTAVGDTDLYFWFKDIVVTDSQVKATVFNQTGSTINVKVRWYLFEVPL